MEHTNKPVLSIVLCTYNNCDSLGLTLKQLQQQVIKDSTLVELLIIDNNSTDLTADTAAGFLTSPISTRYIFEATQGLSHARNTGVKHALGQYILFTDDDANIPIHWAQSYLDVVQTHTPVCAYSKIAVIWDQPKPWWYISAYRSYFVELDYGDHLIDVHDIHHEFFGKNFCVLKSELLEQGGFDPKLGRMGSKLVAGEETMIYRKIVNANKKIIYFPDAGVGHRLKAKEYTEEHIHKLFIDGAYTSYHLAQLNSSKKIMGRPVGLIVQALLSNMKSLFKWTLSLIKGNKQLQLLHRLTFLKSCKTIKLWVIAP